MENDMDIFIHNTTDTDEAVGVPVPKNAVGERIGVAECLTLVKHLSAKEDLDPEEEDLFGALEFDLRAELVAEEFTNEIARQIDFEAPESAAWLESFGAWSQRLKNGKETDIA